MVWLVLLGPGRGLGKSSQGWATVESDLGDGARFWQLGWWTLQAEDHSYFWGSEWFVGAED